MSFVHAANLGALPMGDYAAIQAASYPFSRDPVTLFDGSQVNPATTEPNWDMCRPFACGADPQNMAVRWYCSWWGYSGAFAGCTDPQCEPYRSRIPHCTLPPVPPNLPQAVVETLPPPPPVLTPLNIVQPMPDITRTLEPEPVPVADCSLWCVINAAIANHPYIAVGLLVATALLVKKGGR